MISRTLIVVSLIGAASVASAQATKTPPTTKTAAPPATKTAAPPATKTDAKTAGTKAPAQGTAGTKGAGQPGLAVAPEAAQRPRTPVIMREVFDYDAEGRRDPFFSLLSTAELRPTVADLRVVGILYDPSGRRSVVTLREISSNTRYQVTTGTTLGRMKVVLIKPRAVIFSIEEFGLNRQDSLVLGDTSKARAR